MNGILSPALERRPTEKTNQYVKTVTNGVKNAQTIPSAEPAYLALKSLNENCNNNFCSENILEN